MKTHQTIRLVELLELAYADASSTGHKVDAEQIDSVQACVCLRYAIVQTESPGDDNPTGTYEHRKSVSAVEVEPADAQAYYEMAEMVADSLTAEEVYQDLMEELACRS